MNVRRFLYLSALLLLPALLRAQNGELTNEVPPTQAEDLFSFLLTAAFLVLIIPIGLCITHSKRPGWFARWRLLLWVVGFMVFSWVCINAMVFIPYALGLSSIRGPEAAFALVLGWLYLPITALPVLTIYVIIQVVRGKIHKRIILWPLAVMAFLYCCLLIYKQYGTKALPLTQTNSITPPIH